MRKRKYIHGLRFNRTANRWKGSSTVACGAVGPQRHGTLALKKEVFSVISTPMRARGSIALQTAIQRVSRWLTCLTVPGMLEVASGVFGSG